MCSASRNRAFPMLLVVFVIGVLSGCASTDDLTKLKSAAEQANQTANIALTEANKANLAANTPRSDTHDALVIARQADQTANKAKAEADNVMRLIMALNQKLDQMAQKSLQ